MGINFSICHSLSMKHHAAPRTSNLEIDIKKRQYGFFNYLGSHDEGRWSLIRLQYCLRQGGFRNSELIKLFNCSQSDIRVHRTTDKFQMKRSRMECVQDGPRYKSSVVSQCCTNCSLRGAANTLARTLPPFMLYANTKTKERVFQAIWSSISNPCTHAYNIK